MSKISLKNLSHSYLNSQVNKEDWALRNVNIDWNDGGAYALLGPYQMESIKKMLVSKLNYS